MLDWTDRHCIRVQVISAVICQVLRTTEDDKAGLDQQVLSHHQRVSS